MRTDRIEFRLKDGRLAVLRNPEEKDIEGMLWYLKISSGETEFLMRYPEECERYTVENEKALFDRCNASETEVMLVCIVDGKFAGNCCISWNNRIKTGHRASVAIALLSEFWNQGIGTRMFQEMIQIAERNPRLMQLELEFIEGNARGCALYEKMGFRITGVKPNAIRLKDGTMLNEYSMIRELKR